ncbi:hypothetical protein [Polaromonas sp. A23]|uniref:hypothetical protein n=1 Tax=Polaromonas sp. A23 TaxID=1944133 RepID=UPI0009874B58|nr:hypothetical protein [Polaromonas sp. A23]OOG44223.1 hypothetical protein B0B52_07010 [Polaromonas sp. A23]
MNKNIFVMSALVLVLAGASGGAMAQPSTMPDGATQVPPEMGVAPPRPAASAPADMKPRKRLQLKPRMKSDELKPALHPELKPEMSPGLQPNSQKPLRKNNSPGSGG